MFLIVTLAVCTLDTSTSVSDHHALSSYYIAYYRHLEMSCTDTYTARGTVVFFARKSIETSKRWIIFCSRGSVYERRKSRFHLSRHFHHTPVTWRPVHNYTRRGGQVTRELVLLQSEESLGLNRPLDHIRERVLNIIYGNHSKTHTHTFVYVHRWRRGKGEKKRKIYVHYSLSTMPVWNCFAHTTSVSFCHRNIQI